LVHVAGKSAVLRPIGKDESGEQSILRNGSENVERQVDHAGAGLPPLQERVPLQQETQGLSGMRRHSQNQDYYP
jgi:hypothetical protein